MSGAGPCALLCSRSHKKSHKPLDLRGWRDLGALPCGTALYLPGSGFILVGVDSSIFGMGSNAWVTRVAAPVVIITRSPG